MLAKSKRIASFVVALMMMLGVISALAQQPAASALPGMEGVALVQAALARGDSMTLKATIKVDEAMVSSLLGGMGGPSQSAELQQIKTVLSALNKLQLNATYNNTNASFVLGTEKGELVTLQASGKDGQNTLTTNLLPGVKLTVDPSLGKSFAAAQGAMDSQAAAKMLTLAQPYANLVTKFVNDAVAQEKAEQGAFDFAEAGKYASRTQVTVTNQLVASLMEQLSAQFKQDKEAQALMDQMIKSNAPAAGTKQAPQTVEEMIAGMDKAAAELKAAAPASLFTVTAYTAENAKAPQYFVVESPADAKDMFNVTVLDKPVENGNDLSISLVVLPQDPTVAGGEKKTTVVLQSATEKVAASPAASPAAPAAAATDWNALRQAVVSGENTKATLVNIQLKSNRQGDKQLSNIVIDMRSAGMFVGINSEGENNLAGQAGGKGQFSLSFLTPTPMVTINYELAESKQAPVALAGNAAETVVLSEKTSEADSEKVKQALLTKGLPQLMQNLKTALPEEAETLVMALQGAPTQEKLLPSPDAGTSPAAEPSAAATVKP